MRGTLGVILSQFPEMHETFILRELRALEGAGVPLRIYSLKRCRDRIVHPEARRLLPLTRSLAWTSGAAWRAAGAELPRHPRRAASTLAWTVRHHAWSPAILGKAVAVWGQALALARHMRADGVCHLHAHWATMPTTAAVVASRW